MQVVLFPRGTEVMLRLIDFAGEAGFHAINVVRLEFADDLLEPSELVCQWGRVGREGTWLGHRFTPLAPGHFHR